MSKTICITISVPKDIATSARKSAKKNHKKVSEWFRDAAIDMLNKVEVHQIRK